MELILRMKFKYFLIQSLVISFATFFVLSIAAAQDQPAREEQKKQKLIKLVPAIGQNLVIKGEVYHVPSSSSFFWDNNLINLKRRNPMGEGILNPKQLEIFKKVLDLQNGKSVGKPLIQTAVGRPALVGMARYKPEFCFLKIDSTSLNNNHLETELIFGIRDNVPPKAKIEKPSDRDCPWNGKIPLGSTLYLVSRSKDPKIKDNYVVFISPSLVPQK